MKDYVTCCRCGINLDSDFAKHYEDKWFCGKCYKEEKCEEHRQVGYLCDAHPGCKGCQYDTTVKS